MFRYLHPADHHPARIRKVNRLFGDDLDFEHTKFPVKIRDICKIEKKNSIAISVFGYENKEKYSICVSKKCLEEKYVDLLLIEEKGKTHYVLVKDFNTFKYGQTLHCGTKHFCLQALSREEILKSHVNECSKINAKQMIKIPKKG